MEDGVFVGGLQRSWRCIGRVAVVLGLLLGVAPGVLFTGGSTVAYAQGSESRFDAQVEAAQTSTPNGVENGSGMAMEAPAQAAPEWLEPKGLNVVDLVGHVPDDHLRDSIVSFTVAGGVLQYIEGRRVNGRVIIRVKVWPRFETYNQTRFNCISLRAISDHWAVAAPAAEMWLYQGSRDITQEITQFDYFYPGLVQPAYPADVARYVKEAYAPIEFSAGGGLEIPANMGCTITLDGIYDQGDLTAVFAFDVPEVIDVEQLGSQTFTFQSYIGPGYSGKLGALQAQMSRFGKRHDKFYLDIPAGTEFLLVTYPPTPVSPSIVGDIERNIQSPSSGSYRLARGEATLSVDHNVTMGLPLYAQYRDMDQEGDRFLKRIEGIDVLTSLEYFVPEGVPYDPCMQEGGCPDSLLNLIYNTQMQMTVHYYSVDRVSDGLVRVPLRQVGEEYEASSTASLPIQSNTTTLTPPSMSLYLPLVQRTVEPDTPNLPSDDPEDCPCGWFTQDGRLVDVIPEAYWFERLNSER